MTLLSMQDKTASGKPLPCEHCDSGDQVMSRCTDCSVFMCEFCVTAHKRINTFKGHQILSLAEVQKLGSKALVKPSFCTKHAGETLKLFCETCQETICRDCTIVDHRDHKYNFVADVAERERKVVQSSLNQAESKERAVVEGLKAVRTMKERVQSKMSEVNKEVDAFFNEQAKALEYYRANVKHEVTTQCQVRVSQLEKQAEVLSCFLAQLRSGMDFTNQAIADGDDVKLLSLKKQLTQRLAQLNSSQTPCKPCQGDYLKLQVHQTIWAIKEMATLRYKPIDPQKCTVSFVGGEEGVMYQSLAGQIVELLLTNRDEGAEPGENQVNAQVLFATGGDQENRPHVEALAVLDNGDGTFTFSYCPKSAGRVRLSVMVEGQEVHGSPFTWEVYPVLPAVSDGNRRVKKSVKRRPNSVREEEDAGNEYASGFKVGRYCWKLHLVGFSADSRCSLEIGVNSSLRSYPMAVYGQPFDSRNPEKWSWSYSAWDQLPFRSDRQEPSITSVEEKDVFTLFLNFETEKLVIYNQRSKQSEIFNGVQGNGLFPISSCQLRGVIADVYPSLNVLID